MKSLEPQTNAILISIEKQRAKIDKHGMDRRVSTWQLMLSMIVGNAKRKEEQAKKQLEV